MLYIDKYDRNNICDFFVNCVLVHLNGMCMKSACAQDMFPIWNHRMTFKSELREYLIDFQILCSQREK
jgi:hypothetical protein